MSKTSKILSIIFYSIILFTGLLTIAFAVLTSLGVFNYDSSLVGSGLKNIILFCGVLIIIFGALVFLKNENIAIFFERVLKKIYSFFKNEERYHLYVFLGLFIFAIFVRLFFINRPLSYQEAYNFINYIAKPFFSGTLKYDTSNNFVLNSIFISVLHYAFGEKLWVLRIVSFTSGVLLCPAVYITARIYFNKFTALIAASLVAASPILIVYSTTSTGISLYLLITTLFFAFAGYLRDKDEVIPWILFVFLSVLGFICSPLFFYPFFTIFLWLIISSLLKDGILAKKQQLKKVLIYSVSSVVLSYVFYIPETMKNGLQKILTLNFPQTSSLLLSLKSLVLTFNISWSQWNIWLPIFFGPVFIITIILAMAVIKKESIYKIPVLFIIIAVLFLAVLKRIDFQNDSLVFILPVLIIMSSQGAYLIINKIFSKKINLKAKAIIIFSIIIAVFIVFIGFNSNFIYSIDKDISPPETENIIISLKNDLTPEGKLSAIPPLDYYFMFYSYKNGVSMDYWSSDIYSYNKFLIFQSKASGKDGKTIIDEYFKGKSAHMFGFTEPEVFKDYKSVTIFRIEALRTSEIPALSYDTIKSQGILKNGKIDIDTKEIIFDGTEENKLKMLQVPINLEQNSDYLITFEIKKEGKLVNNIFIDFFGGNYDKPTQESSISPNEINDSYTKFRYVLNSGRIPQNTPIFFRVFTTQASYQIYMKDLKVSKVLDQ